MHTEQRTSHARWQAVSQRNPAFHASFLYGVTSTKIYCRPTCSARRARRANVVFYDTEAQAVRDGFRPCKRCRPDDVTFLGDKEETVLTVLALLQVRRNEATMKYGLKELAQQVHVSPTYLCRVFKTVMGVTIGQYMHEFESVADDGAIDFPLLPPPPSSDMTDSGMKLAAPATLAMSPVQTDSTLASTAGMTAALSSPDVGLDGWQMDTRIDALFDDPDIFFNFKDFEVDFSADPH